jgi:hypothetical protein
MESQASTPAPASTPVSQRITKDATTAGHQWNPDLEAYFND